MSKLDELRAKLMSAKGEDLEMGLEITRDFCESALRSIDGVYARTGKVHPSREKVLELLRLVERLEKDGK